MNPVFVRVLAQVASRWLLIAGDRVGSHSHQCGIYGKQTRNGTRYLSTSVLLFHYRTTNFQ
jgi:hypothetical protein